MTLLRWFARATVMRKRIWMPLALAGVAAIGFFGIAPGYIEGSMNVVDGKPLIEVSEEAKALHKTLVANGPHVCIIGGAEIYEAFLPLADRIELTEIAASPKGDTLLPAIDKAEWTEIARSSHKAAGDVPAHDFVTLARKQGE